jgi:exoribonuclease II
LKKYFVLLAVAVKAMHGDNVREAEASEEDKEAAFGSKVKGG